MNGKAEKQQGREAAGGFRATIEGFPLREKEPRAYGNREREKERGSKRTRSRARTREREKRWSKRQRRGYATTMQKKDRTRRGREGGRAKREGP